MAFNALPMHSVHVILQQRVKKSLFNIFLLLWIGTNVVELREHVLNN